MTERWQRATEQMRESPVTTNNPPSPHPTPTPHPFPANFANKKVSAHCTVK